MNKHPNKATQFSKTYQPPIPGGAFKKGKKHLSTYIQEMLEDEDFETYLQHPTKGFVEYKGMPVKAIITVAVRKALQGDASAMEWIAKHGYGTKIVIETEDPVRAVLMKMGLIEGEVVGDRQVEGSTSDTPKDVS